MDWHEDERTLVAELEALRPEPREAFTAELDARVAAGFPEADGDMSSRPNRFAEVLRPSSWRRLAVPAGATALAAIVVATAVVSISESGPDPAGGPSSDFPVGAGAAPEVGATPVAPFSRTVAPSADSRAASAGAASEHQLSEEAASTRTGSGPYASQASKREIERSARIVLATDAAEVRAASAEVFSTVHSYDGIVLRSSIRDRDEDEATAVFDLLIPSGKLDDALAAFSGIAAVRSRSDSTVDVTAPTIGLGERLRDSRAKIEGLLAQLAAADTDAERAPVEAELRAERTRQAALRSRLSALQRRTHFARVSLRIESGRAGSTGGDESWEIGDALDDAGRILAIAAGVTVIGLAILTPLALILLLAVLAHRLWTRRSRERVLDDRGPAA